MPVIGGDERRAAPLPGLAELHRGAALDELLPRADFVILTVPHTPETEGFMNRARFRRMKKGAFFINIGRGMTTRLDDLVAALEAGEIAGAALDVFEERPRPPGRPLRSSFGAVSGPSPTRRSVSPTPGTSRSGGPPIRAHGRAEAPADKGSELEVAGNDQAIDPGADRVCIDRAGIFRRS